MCIRDSLISPYGIPAIAEWLVDKLHNLNFALRGFSTGLSLIHIYITHSNSGEGLLFYGSVTLPFVERFPKGEIYNLLTTRPEDMAHERKDE